MTPLYFSRYKTDIYPNLSACNDFVVLCLVCATLLDPWNQELYTLLLSTFFAAHVYLLLLCRPDLITHYRSAISFPDMSMK